MQVENKEEDTKETEKCPFCGDPRFKRVGCDGKCYTCGYIEDCSD